MSTATRPWYDRRFRLFDQDGNGVVNRADFALAAERICAALGLPPGAEHEREVHRAHQALWRTLCAAAGLHQAADLDRDRFAAAMADLTSSAAAFDAALCPPVLAVLDAADADADGRLDDREAQRVVCALGVSSANAADVVARLDLDGDGLLSVDELLAAYKNSAMSDDPHIEGSMFIGTASAS
jgi:Ca2+-binding EF-hand superfamily protein